jgi:7-carboxy-7-deazaguanine synthase
MHKQLKRIEDYQKTLGVLELYTAVQSEGSRQGYPTIVVRTSGCTHRCYFGEGGWCDSWYTSIHPEKVLFASRILLTCMMLILILRR